MNLTEFKALLNVIEKSSNQSIDDIDITGVGNSIQYIKDNLSYGIIIKNYKSNVSQVTGEFMFSPELYEMVRRLLIKENNSLDVLLAYICRRGITAYEQLRFIPKGYRKGSSNIFNLDGKDIKDKTVIDETKALTVFIDKIEDRFLSLNVAILKAHQWFEQTNDVDIELANQLTTLLEDYESSLVHALLGSFIQKLTVKRVFVQVKDYEAFILKFKDRFAKLTLKGRNIRSQIALIFEDIYWEGYDNDIILNKNDFFDYIFSMVNNVELLSNLGMSDEVVLKLKSAFKFSNVTSDLINDAEIRLEITSKIDKLRQYLNLFSMEISTEYKQLLLLQSVIKRIDFTRPLKAIKSVMDLLALINPGQIFNNPVLTLAYLLTANVRAIPEILQGTSRYILLQIKDLIDDIIDASMDKFKSLFSFSF